MTVSTVLALTTLGRTTQIGSFLFFVAPLKVAKASSYVAVAVSVAGVITLNFANGNTALITNTPRAGIYAQSKIFYYCTQLSKLIINIIQHHSEKSGISFYNISFSS